MDVDFGTMRMIDVVYYRRYEGNVNAAQNLGA